MNRLLAPLLALSLWPALALAQSDQGMGLDLTGEDANKTEEKKPEDTPLAEPAPAPTEPKASTPQAEKAPAPEVLPTDITQEDRVKSVQRKVYLKKGRFEFTPQVSVSVNDPYYSKIGVSGKVAYFFADTLSVAVRGSKIQLVPSDDVRTAKRVFHGRIFYSVPQYSVMADAEWSPLYGKVAFLNSILHFDGYLLGGLGVVRTETSALPGRGPNGAADLGVGLRFVAKDFLAVNAALINTSYVDRPLGTTKGSLQNVMTINAGVSVFFPLHSTGREGE